MTSLADDANWKAFQKAVGVPDQVTGLLYVDVGRLLGLAKTFTSDSSASDKEALDNLATSGAWSPTARPTATP